MYYYLNGTLVYRDQCTAVIDCGGVGYKMTTSLICSDALSSKMNSTVKLFTHLSVREDGIELFGFISEEERNVFNLLIGVSGVGPKAAMALLSAMTPDKLVFAIGTEDTKILARANGIGAKTAARICLELKDKLSSDFFRAASGMELPTTENKSTVTPAQGGKLSEATEALMALGYDRSQILSALRGLDTEKLSLEQIITAALKKFVK